MALETLKGLTEIGGFEISRGKPDHMTWAEFDEVRRDIPILITDEKNMISFKIQKGPVKYNGVNRGGVILRK